MIWWYWAQKTWYIHFIVYINCLADRCLDDPDRCLDDPDRCLDNPDRCLDDSDKYLGDPVYKTYFDKEKLLSKYTILYS